jgi:Domain of unknown function (DUF1735)
MKKNLLKICAAILAVVLTGCLDDKEYALDPSGTKNIIEFSDNSIPSNPAGAVYPVWTATTEILPSYTFEQTISYSGPNSNNSDIELTLAVDELALEEYNEQRIAEDENADATYTMMPDTYFSFDDFNVTIPKGQTKVNISITVFPDQFDLTKNFALPIRIVSSSEGIISSQWSAGLFAVVVKNKYDGIYKILGGQVTRLVSGVPDPALSGEYNDDLEMDLVTINGNTNGIIPLWKDGSGIGGVAGTRVAINETTNAVTVTATGNASLQNFPATTNAYTPATKTFELNFTWSTPGTREVKNLILEYDRPRP